MSCSHALNEVTPYDKIIETTGFPQLLIDHSSGDGNRHFLQHKFSNLVQFFQIEKLLDKFYVMCEYLGRTGYFTPILHSR